jgi:ketol-acid reductoisomerase
MKKILQEIQSGQYAREFILENRAGAHDAAIAARNLAAIRSRSSASGCAR